MTFREVGLALCAISSLASLGRMLFLLIWRRPVLARIVGTDYDESSRAYDRDFRQIKICDGYPETGDIPFRSIAVRARYRWADVEYAEDVSVYVRKGDSPARQQILWIDPDRPARATASGIGIAAVWLLGIGTFAVALWYLPF